MTNNERMIVGLTIIGTSLTALAFVGWVASLIVRTMLFAHGMAEGF